jgi:hypothetical protein
MISLYQMLNGGAQNNMPMMQQMRTPMNMYQRMGNIMQAMRNPVAFVKQSFPDIPDQISNDPNAILNYLQKTRGITDQQINELKMYGGR